MLEEVLERVLGFRRPKILLNTADLPIEDLKQPSMLYFTLVTGDGRPCTALVKQGNEVKPGQALGDDGTRQVAVCTCKGKVAGIALASDVRGAKGGRVVMVEPDPSTSPKGFDGLDPEKAPVASMWDRIDQAGVVTDALTPRPLADVIGPRAGIEIETLVVSAADRDAEVNSALALFRKRGKDAFAAAALLSKLCGAKKVLMAVPDNEAGHARGKQTGGVEILPVSVKYPESLEPMIADKLGGGDKVRVVMVETALAAYDAIAKGVVQDSKIVTFIGPRGSASKNLRVPLGTRLKDIFSSQGLKPRDHDKVIAGGPMRGYAQFSLDSAVDQGVDAVMLIPHESQVPWSDEPCVNSGSCVSVCPVNLEVGLLGRYAEFGLWDEAEARGAMNCIDCGLCAMVCTARRPLVQMIRLAKQQILARRAEAQVMETEKANPPESSVAEQAAAASE